MVVNRLFIRCNDFPIERLLYLVHCYFSIRTSQHHYSYCKNWRYISKEKYFQTKITNVCSHKLYIRLSQDHKYAMITLKTVSHTTHLHSCCCKHLHILALETDFNDSLNTLTPIFKTYFFQDWRNIWITTLFDCFASGHRVKRVLFLLVLSFSLAQNNNTLSPS